MKLHLPGQDTPCKPGKILCIGRNYALHAQELGNAIPSEPLVFLKPSTALLPTGGTIVLPPQSQDVHHEVELVVAIGRKGRHLTVAEALDYVAGYAVGLDLTARDLQAKAKAKGHPWSIAKGFDTFAPIGNFAAAADVADVQDLEVALYVNGIRRQHGLTRDMLFPVADLIAYCASVFTLEQGDLIYTGTPAGVSALAPGDMLEATISGLPTLRAEVALGDAS